MVISGALKAEGNGHFRLKKYADAYRCCTTAIQKCPRTMASELSNLYATLSATELIPDKPAEAIQSATSAIELDRSNYKAYVRRAAPYSEMMQLQEALDDFEAVTRLQPGEPYLCERTETGRRRLLESGRGHSESSWVSKSWKMPPFRSA
jgi:serine/threonine-protein phosphatase 5